MLKCAQKERFLSGFLEVKREKKGGKSISKLAFFNVVILHVKIEKTL